MRNYISRAGSIAVLLFASLLSVYAQSGAQFGKNKVQYRDFDWKFIESKHFDIYYYQGGRELAEFTSVKAEEALTSLQNDLKYNITKRVSIIVYNSHNEFQQTNVIAQYLPEGVGGVTELLKNRVVLPFAGDYEQFRHVIHHELTHAVLNDMLYGGTFQTAMYVGNNIQFPIWMNEGLAEYESLHGMDVQNDMFMRDVSLSDQLEDLGNLDGYYAYRGGQTFYWYIAREWGEQRVGELINRIKIYGTLDAAFKATFQMSFDDFARKWRQDIKVYYYPDIATFRNPSDFATRITDHSKDHNFYNSSPEISPDGSKMAFISDRDGYFKIFIQKLNNDKNEKPRELISSSRQQDFEELNMLTPGISWNPPGNKLAISAKSGGEDAIYLVDAESGDYDRIRLGMSGISSVNWSYDGSTLCFIGDVAGASDLYTYNLATKQLANLTNDLYSDFHPVWSYDGKTIYFVSDRGDNLVASTGTDARMWKYKVAQSDIYSIDVASRQIKRITTTPEYHKTSLAISPDGTRLLYVSDDNGISNIYEMFLESGLARPMTNSLDGITQLSLDRDANKLLFCTQIGGGYDIFQIRNPFEKKLDIDTLPLTKFRKSTLEKKGIISGIEAAMKDTSKSKTEKPELRGYGKYDIEFSRQQVVRPNPDVVQNPQSPAMATSKGEFTDTSFIEHEYKLRFTPDVIMGNPGYSTFYGFQGVAQAMFSDILGNHQIYVEANLYYDIKNSNFGLTYLYLPNKIDYAISAYHQAIYTQDTSGYFYRFRKYGIDVNAYLPFDMFNRIEWGLGWKNFSKENIDDPTQPSQYDMLFVPRASYVHDDVFWGWFAPVLGSRYYFEVEGTPKLSNSGIGFMTIMTDVRHYIPLFDNLLNIAVRGTCGISLGPDPQRFSLGGEENWINATFRNGIFPFNRPEDFEFMHFAMPMRGPSVDALDGTQFFLVNAELRFPLFRALLAGPLPILIQGVMGSVFFDMGSAWSGPLKSFKATRFDENGFIYPNDLLMSSGIGARAFILGLPLKLDVAWQNLYHNWSQPTYLISLGYDF